MTILGIESSCDDTSIVLARGIDESVTILQESSKSQIDMHAQYGGVVPEVAARMHAETIVPLLMQIYTDDQKPDVIAVTTGPGLMTSLMVGVETARLLSYFTGIPVVGVNHIGGHVYANFISDSQAQSLTPPNLPFAGEELPQKSHSIAPKFPLLALVVSGGHTELILMKDHLEFEKIGATLDDAAGECFDKIAKMIGLAYPGGPKISKLAQQGNQTSHHFPRPLLDRPDFNFSFSGLKTSALYFLHDHPEIKTDERAKQDFAAAIEEAIVETLVTKTIRASQQTGAKTIVLAGGVAANAYLRAQLAKKIEENLEDVTFHMPSIAHCMDNAAMIASAGYFMARAGKFTDWKDLKADSGWEL